MFNSKKDDGGDAETTIIASGVSIRGDVHFSGSLFLEGCIEGSVNAHDNAGEALFTLTDRGRVVGQIHVSRVVIDGTVEGDIHCAERLELAQNALVSGDVHYNVLEMAAGAKVTGRMIHATAATRQLTGPDAGHTDTGRDAMDNDLPSVVSSSAFGA